jgi:bla regulator protein BlaR1
MLPAAFPRRLVWCVIIPVSIVLPGMYRYHHQVSVVGLQQAAQISSFDAGISPVWLTMTSLLILWGLANVGRVWLAVSRSRRSTIIDGVPVVITDSLGPATVGLWRSKVLVPLWVLGLPGDQRRYVLRHEDEHRTSHDAHLLFFASLSLLLMPWNLALWWQLRRLCLAIEIDCDDRVVSALGDAPAYGELLLKVAQAASHGPRLQPAFLGGMGSLERRLTALLAPTPLRHLQRFLLPTFALGLLFVVAWMPHPILGSHAHASYAAHTTEVSATQR